MCQKNEKKEKEKEIWWCCLFGHHSSQKGYKKVYKYLKALPYTEVKVNILVCSLRELECRNGRRQIEFEFRENGCAIRSMVQFCSSKSKPWSS